ncbi:MAG TPA: four helix bundle protein [Lacunisphaera sp.]|nr:four helix bundle protein [Lacunisphaera sp.]
MGESFETTEAWKVARMLTNFVYGLTRRGLLARDFALRDQLQRAAVSVMNNVAEGWVSLHALEKRQAYNYARRSCGEVRSMGYVLADNKFISTTEHAQLTSLCVQPGKLISGLIRSLGDR